MQEVNAQHETCTPDASALGLKSMTEGLFRPGIVFTLLHDPPIWLARKGRRLPVSPEPPTARQSPGFQHDTEPMPDVGLVPVPEIPGTARTGPQFPLVSVTRNACEICAPPPVGADRQAQRRRAVVRRGARHRVDPWR